jgi:hypothetical protein
MLKSILRIAAAALALGLAINTASAAADAAQQKRRVVMQVNDDKSEVWNHALTLAENMQINAGGKDNIEIEIVAMSPGIRMVANDSSAASRVSKAIDNGVLVRACGNTLKIVGWDEDKLIPGVKTVPFGALEVIDRQNEGWAYLKP